MTARPAASDRAWAELQFADFDLATATVAAPDLLTAAGLRAVTRDTPIRAVEAAVRRLGELLSVDGTDRLRRAAIREEGVTVLRAAGIRSPARLVDAALRAAPAAAEATRTGRAIDLRDPEPWPCAVDGAGLLDDIAGMVARYVILPAGATELISVWVAHTYVMHAWDHTGYLGVVSPTRRCGKTTLLRIVGALANRALGADNISPAALYRVVEQSSPTLVIDELDRIPRDSDVWGVVNSGHTRGGSVIRCAGDESEPRAYSTYAAMVLAYIRGSRPTVPDTVEDRCIRITMQRRARAEARAKLRSRLLAGEAEPLRRRLARWAVDHGDALAAASPAVPEDLDDRAADSWEPLLAVADAAGGRWPELARQLAVEYSGDRADEEAESPGIELVADLRDLMAGGDLVEDDLGLSGDVMVRLLRGVPERPWGTWGRAGDGLTETALARLLRPLGIRSQMVGPRDRRRKRYSVVTLREAWERYAPSVRLGVSLTPSHQAPAAPVTDSAGGGVRVCGYEPHAGDAADTYPHTGVPADVYHHVGRDYRTGETLPDGRMVESVESGIPILIRPRRRETGGPEKLDL